MNISKCFSAGAAATAFALAGFAPLAAQVPTDNPIDAFYAGDPHAADYAWVDDLAWENVHNILDYGAVADGNGAGDGIGVTDNRAAFQAAVDAAYNDGGGVVYIPAGSYYFSDHLFLKSGVVVRGETPAVTDAHDDAFAPPTRLEFPRYFFLPEENGGAGMPNDSAFKFIYVEDNSNAGHLGMVWLDINRAGISMSADGSGTENRLVFGTRTNNVASPDTGIPQLQREVDGVQKDFQKPWQRFSYRFVRNVHVFAQRNVLVANNRVNDKHYRVDHQLDGWESTEVDDFLQTGYIVQDTKKVFGSNSSAFVALDETHEPWFSYTNHYGIYVRGGSGSIWGAAPFETPSLFRPGVTVRDNWVYSTMRVGYHLSGWGLKVLNNVKKDRAGKSWWIHPTGLYTLSGAQTLENRGVDVGGSRILLEGNDFEVFRHLVNGGPYQSTDGEGVLVQECCGGTTLDDIRILDNRVNAYIGIYKMPYTRNIHIAGNTVEGAGYIMVNANKNGSQAPVFDIFVENNTFLNGRDILVTGDSGGGGIFIRDNAMNGGKITYPEGISTLSGNTGTFTESPYTVGSVRDYPVLELEDPTVDGSIEPGETTLQARVTGSFLNPDPVDESELPEIVLVEIYANTTLVASFTANPSDPESVAWLYETPWDATLGYYQLSAKAVPSGYNGPTGSTEWFTVSDVIPVVVRDANVLDLYADWLELHFPGETDPAVIGDAADIDMDGLPNLLEFVLGSDPVMTDVGASPSLVQGEGQVHFRYRMREELGDTVHVQVVKSTDFETWTEVDPGSLAEVADGGDLPAGIREYTYVLPSDFESPTVLKLQISRDL